MARVVSDCCVGCEVCVHCTGGREVIHYTCDACDLEDNIDGETEIFEDGGSFYCAACLLRKHMTEFIKDMIDEHGEEWCRDNFDKAPDAV